MRECARFRKAAPYKGFAKQGRQGSVRHGSVQLLLLLLLLLVRLLSSEHRLLLGCSAGVKAD